MPDPESKMEPERTMMAVQNRLTELDRSVEELESRVKELESHERTQKSMREQFAGAQARHVAKALGRWTWHDILVYDNLPQFGTGEYIDSMQTPNTNE